MKRFIYVFAALLMLASLADAGGYYAYRWYPAGWYGGVYYQAGYYQVYVVEKVSYGVSYDAAADAAIQQAKAAKELAAAARELAGVALELRQSQVLPLRVDDGRGVLVKNCAACHGKDTAAEKGGEFVLIDGDKLAALTKGDRKRVAGRVNSTDAAERMPPGRQLPVFERKAVAELMQQAAAPAKKQDEAAKDEAKKE